MGIERWQVIMREAAKREGFTIDAKTLALAAEADLADAEAKRKKPKKRKPLEILIWASDDGKKKGYGIPTGILVRDIMEGRSLGWTNYKRTILALLIAGF